MRLTAKQKALLHWVPARLGMRDDARRLVQRNVGGFHSSADAVSREGFIAVMAFYEDRFDGRQVPGFTAGYWRAQSDEANPTDAQVHRARLIARRMGWSDADLDRWACGPRMAGGQYERIEEMPAYWMRRVIDGLRAMEARLRGGGARARGA